MEKDIFIKELNAKRKSGNWYAFSGTVNGKIIQIKGYKTWLQIFNIDGINNSGCMEISVKEFNALLNEV